MSSRYISVEEINSILAAIEDKNGIDLLKEIRDNTIKESDVQKQQQKKPSSPEEAEKDTQERSFIGYAKEDDIAKNDDVKKGTLNRLALSSLVTKGGFIPRGGEQINSYKLTDEGLALLYLVDRINKEGSNNPTRKPYQEKQEREEEQPQQQRETRKQEREEQSLKQRLKID